jgi:hypothetical protein
VTIVMGLDQHRAQITCEWIDTETGEVSRARVAPADRAGVRRFLAGFAGRELEVALEATTGIWTRCSSYVPHPPHSRPESEKQKTPHLRGSLLYGSDGTRTRDLRRDRPAL